MSLSRLTATRRRALKAQLARRRGWRCTYCRGPFTTLREATIDHIVPVSLYRTWAAVNLTLACWSCNHAKADRLPLSMALLLAWSAAPGYQVERVEEVGVPPVDGVDGVDVHGFHPAFTGAGGVFTPPAGQTAGSVDRCGNRLVESGGSRMNGRSTSTSSPSIDWRLLARLAHVRQSATRTPRTPIRTPSAVTRTAPRTATRSPERSGCDLPVHRGRTAPRTATSRLCGDGRTTA
ncbi:HNH endonuclease [Streptomyces sp. NPDC057729]|uniref:HNH endonuclease n=1 Tax=Streptomyces sp. NPDC057729 TaxID=3346230 RepID=UPI0036854B10